MSTTEKSRSYESEIIRQRKSFIFNVEQSSAYVFPDEEYTYLVYIKNTSGVDINNFNIKIEAPKEVNIEKSDNKPDQNIVIKKGESYLYEFTSSIDLPGEYIVHFIGYGESSQVLHKSLKIKCSRSYNSDKLIHKIHIYDFTPYEDNFTMEASNYSNEVTQTFKTQKLPYESGNQPFKMIVGASENTESESYINQNTEAKNSKEEHVYQYISREDFTEDSSESYEGENLYDIINQINKESKYFNATFLKTGTNSLLNDFTQYKPNGFIYRMGLLTSELFHVLGVIPTYEYMSDRLFRWAPSPSGQRIFHDRDIDEMDAYDEILNLYPKPKSMNWDENIWAGRGWIVYKLPTDDYKETEEFQKLFDDKTISLKENIGSFEQKKDAEIFVEQKKYFDNVVRNQIRSDLVKFEYSIEESLYDTGVFFINIPLNKIPSNFYLINEEDLYKIINRAKPYGVKPIINYIIEGEFNLDLSFDTVVDYQKEFIHDIGEFDMKHSICENRFVYDTIECGDESVNLIREVPTNCLFYNNDFELDLEMDTDYSEVGIDFYTKDFFDMDIESDNLQYKSHLDQDFRTLKDILDVLYNNNYNNISFQMDPYMFDYIPKNITNTLVSNNRELFFQYTDGGVHKTSLDSLKLPITKNSSEENLSITDSFDRVHKISAQYDSKREMHYIKYMYQNTNGKEYIRKEGFQYITGVIAIFGEYNNRKILLFMVQDINKKLHYFYHTIVEDIQSFVNTSKLMRGVYVLDQTIRLETPFCYCLEKQYPKITNGENWSNLYRLNNSDNSYTYIQNTSNSSITPDDILLYFDNINIPKTSIIKEIRLNLNGRSTNRNIYLDKSIGENYKINDILGYSLELKPNKIEHYSQSRESNSYYQNELEKAQAKGQTSLVEYFKDRIDYNDLFNEEVNAENSDYINDYNDYITVSHGYWNELSEFTDLENNLNDTENIILTIEGYNDGYEVDLLSQVVSDLNQSSVVKTKVPEGYFFLEIPLLYSNNFLLNLLRVRFRFSGLNHSIKIFNTTLDVKFKTKQNEQLNFDFVEEFIPDSTKSIKILEDYIYPQDINNGVICKLSFDDLNIGEFYRLHTASLDIIYQDTDMELMINKHKYQYKPTGESVSIVLGSNSEDALVNGTFYNDVASICQIESDVGMDNQGIELQDTIFQEFEAREDNITSIELFPNGFVGNPDETLKIGIYTNHENTPNKLIKEIYANGWVKNNDELKTLPSIKYNLNVDNLQVNEKYWIKIQVLNPRDNSYYLLKSVNKTLSRHKLLYMKNNNYINTFSSLTFNIYSKNLSKSFRNLPAIQEFFDNPYILVGLHRGIGTISNLTVDEWDETYQEEDHMKGYFDDNIEMILSDSEQGIGITITTEDSVELVANFEKNKWDRVE